MNFHLKGTAGILIHYNFIQPLKYHKIFPLSVVSSVFLLHKFEQSEDYHNSHYAKTSCAELLELREAIHCIFKLVGTMVELNCTGPQPCPAVFKHRLQAVGHSSFKDLNPKGLAGILILRCA